MLEAVPGCWLAIQPDEPVYTVLTASSDYSRMLHTNQSWVPGRRLFDVLSRVLGPGYSPWLGQLYASLQKVRETYLPDVMNAQELPFRLPVAGSVRPAKQTWRAINTPVLDENGELQYILHSLEIVPEPARPVAAIRRTEQRLRVAVESAHVGVWEFLPRPRKLYWSSLSAALHGRPDTRLLNAETYLQCIAPEDSERVKAHLAAALHPGGTGEIDIEYRVLAGDELRWIAAQGRVFFGTEAGGARRPVRATGTMLDITARKCAETEQERLLEELQRSNRELARYSQVVSHDLQTPLRTIRSFTQLLARSCESTLDKSSQEYIDRILGGAEMMQKLIHGLLQYAQVGAGPAVSETVPLRALFADVLTMLQPALDESDAVITCHPLPEVQGDPMQIQQLFQNLLGNALKYSRPGVRPQIAVRVQEAADHWVFEFEDNGMGIAPEHRDVIFEPMQRLHGAEIPGTGIGLAVCRQIVERHQGRIWVESVPGIGSTFRFTLPR